MDERTLIFCVWIDLINLRILRLTRSPIRDIRPLSSLKNLVELDLRETNVEDRTPLSGLPNLSILQINSSLGIR
jgi:internalin A